MSRISINKASIDFNVTRNTLYKYIKNGKLTKDADGKLDTADLVRLFSNKKNQQQPIQEYTSTIKQPVHTFEAENIQLKQQLAISEMLINELRKQIEDLRADKQELYNQINQKRLEVNNRTFERKSFIAKLFG